MAEKKTKTEDLKGKAEDLLEDAEKLTNSAKDYSKESYDKVIARLNDEKERLERELKQEYRNAKNYVREHLEKGVGYSFLGGIVLGIVIAKIFD